MFIPTLGSKTPVGSSQAYMYVFLSLCLSGCPRRFLAIICAARNCAQRMQLQTTGSISLNGSIICPSVCLSGRPQAFCAVCMSVCLYVFLQVFCDFLFVFISSLGCQHRYAFILTLGSEGPQWGPFNIICLYLSLCNRPHHFLAIKSCDPWLRVAHTAAGHGFKSSKWQNNMSIHPVVWLSAVLLLFLHFY